MRRYILAFCLAVGAMTCAPSAYADVLGQTYDVRVNSSYDALGASRISTTLRAVSDHAYFYVDDRYWVSLSSETRTRFLAGVRSLAAQFDSVTYPRSVALWGSEATPGVDGDPRVVIVLEQIVRGSGGYFETIHNYPTERAPEGNTREMIFISVESVFGGTAPAFVAHELQHLISFNQRELSQRASDDVWLNEGRSEYAITSVGLSDIFEGSTLQRRTQTFLRSPSDSLTDWPNTSVDYAAVSLFVHYLVDQFGSPILSSSLRSSLTGVAALNEWLAAHSQTTFERVFTNWMVALLVNERHQSPAYGYVRDGLNRVRVQAQQSTYLSSANAATAFTETLREWQPFWIQADIQSLDGSAADARVRIDGDTGVVWHGAIIATYGAGERLVMPFHAPSGTQVGVVPLQRGGGRLASIAVAVAQGSEDPVSNRRVAAHSVTVRIATDDSKMGDDTVSSTAENASSIVDGDLIRRRGQPEVSVVWGSYRRHLTEGVLALYGFQERPVIEVSDDVFFSYNASVYVRAQGAQRVYAVWPDNTKHWLNITAVQWDASQRDWGAIFTVNNAEIAQYAQGVDIVR